MTWPAEIQQFFDGMWQDYVRHATSAPAIHQLLGAGEPIINDHIALRSCDLPAVNLDRVARPLLDMGFVEAGQYRFEAKKLRARHYQHSDPTVPKIFVSELILGECAPPVSQLLQGRLEAVGDDPISAGDFLYSGRHWPVSHREYQQLREHSEYAAWFAAFGFRANHFTVSVNDLPGFDDLAGVNDALLAAGYPLNEAGGLIKGGPAQGLAQSSTLADQVEVEFTEGAVGIPGAFCEFAQRYPDRDGRLFQGFVEASADKIFESTNVRN